MELSQIQPVFSPRFNLARFVGEEKNEVHDISPQVDWDWDWDVMAEVDFYAYLIRHLKVQTLNILNLCPVHHVYW
jgi:hypothetical protein